jgi:DNA invertase Pin-like site-specific DNA recombinase
MRHVKNFISNRSHDLKAILLRISKTGARFAPEGNHPMKPKRVAIYMRVSTGDQTANLQKDELPEYAQFRKWTVTEVYSDVMSGAKDKRPALDRLMADARRGKIDVVLVWKFDRFARSTSHLLRALEEFKSLGVDFVSLSESIDTSSPTGKAMFTCVRQFQPHSRRRPSPCSLHGFREPLPLLHPYDRSALGC